MTDDNIISAHDLVRDFDGLRAVDGVSIDVRRGEIFGFLGPNGAGKTTTINMLCTLLRPTSGTALLAGYDIVTQPSLVRLSIGLVFQDPSLDERLTARENLQFHAMIYAVPRTERGDRIQHVLEMVELADRADDIVRTFSGGMKRRLEIARGLLHYPRVLFLDEPTLGLDPQTRKHIWSYIVDLKQKEDITIFMTTHYMDEAENCDRLAIIDHGKIIALDTPEHLKGRVGGDVIRLSTADNDAAKRALQEKWQLEARSENGELVLEVAEGNKFVPRLITQLGIEVDSVTLRRPTLDDVFLSLTGRAIRDESAGTTERWRSQARMWQRGPRERGHG